MWFQGNAQISTLAVGLLGVSLGLNFIWAAIAIIAGVLVGTLFMAFHSAQGPKLGLPQMIQSRAQFGYYGSLLPVVVAVLLFIGFNVFNTLLGGDVIQSLFPGTGTFVAMLPVVVLSVVLTDRRLSLHPHRAALRDLAVHRRLRRLHHRVAVHRLTAGALV